MTNSSWSVTRRVRLLRGLFGFVGVVVGCAVSAFVLILFGAASRTPWLTDTPANVVAMKPCEAVIGTAARRACVETVVATVQARNASTQVARGEPGRQSGR